MDLENKDVHVKSIKIFFILFLVRKNVMVILTSLFCQKEKVISRIVLYQIIQKIANLMSNKRR